MIGIGLDSLHLGVAAFQLFWCLERAAFETWVWRPGVVVFLCLPCLFPQEISLAKTIVQLNNCSRTGESSLPVDFIQDKPEEPGLFANIYSWFFAGISLSLRGDP